MSRTKCLSIKFLLVCVLVSGCAKKHSGDAGNVGTTTNTSPNYTDSSNNSLGFGGGTINGGTGTCPTGLTCTGTVWDTTHNIVRLIQTGDSLGGNFTSGTFASRIFNASSGSSSFKWQTPLPFLKSLPDYASGSVQNETTSNYSSLANSTLMNGILGLWHLDESAGTSGSGSVLDRSGNGFNGTPVNGVTFGSSGKLGAAASFTNSSGKYISVGNMGALPTNGTISFWIYPTIVQNYDNPFSTGGLGSSNTGFRFEENSGNFTFNVGDDGGTNIQPVLISGISANTWYHISLTWDVSQSLVWVYVNGSLVANPSTTNFPSQLGDVSIGAGYDTTRTWDGLIDEVAIWSRTLSAAEELQLYRRGSNQIQFQVRSCPDSTCSTNPAWQGPDGSNGTYFSELFNNSDQTYSGSPFPLGGDLNSAYTILPSLPSMLFSNFSDVVGLSTTSNPYFQYQAVFSSDDTSTSCSYSSSASTWCSPELQSFTVNPL